MKANREADMTFSRAINSTGKLNQNIRSVGLAGSGWQETSQVGLTNSYQNALNTNSNDYNTAVKELNIAISQAKTSGDITTMQAIQTYAIQLAQQLYQEARDAKANEQWEKSYQLQVAAFELEKAAKAGKLNNINIGELTSRVGDEIAANLAIEMGEKSSVFKTDLPAAADYYQALARGDMDTAKTVLKDTLNQIAASSGYKTTSGKTGLSDGIKSYFEKIRDTLSGKKAESKTAESVESAETTDITDSRTGQDTAVGQTENTANNTSNSTVKADPTTGQAGAKALADIVKTNPGLAEEGVGHTDLVDAYNAGRNGTDISRGTRDNASAGNYTGPVEAMYKAGQADAKTGSVDTGVSEAGAASSEGSQGIENGARPTETANGVRATETAETSPGTEQQGTAKTEQPGTAATPKPTSGVNPELEAKLAKFKLSSEERTAAEEYAQTGKDSAISNEFNRDSVKRIMDAAEVIKEHNSQNEIDSRQSEGYNGNNNEGIV